MDVLTLNTLFLIVSAQFNLPPGLLSSLCYVESKHKITAYHKDDGKGNSVGICQIKIQTAKNLGFKGTEKELMKPENNIYYAGAYLQHQRTRYNGDINKAVIAYNIGSAKELTTTKYQAKVFKQWGTVENSSCRLEKSLKEDRRDIKRYPCKYSFDTAAYNRL